MVALFGYFFVLPCLFNNLICIVVLLKIFFWCSGLDEACHEEIARQGTIAVFVCERTKHMVQNKGGQTSLSFFCMHLNDYTLVNNEIFGNSCRGFVLNSLTDSSRCSRQEICLRVF